MDLIYEVLNKSREKSAVPTATHEILQQIVDESVQNDFFQIATPLPSLPSLHAVDIQPELVVDVRTIVENISVDAIKNNAQVIGFTSALEGEGVTTLASATAQIMAEKSLPDDHFSTPADQCREFGQITQHGVLIIDTQFRNPTLHHVFNDSHDSGLIDILTHRASFSQIVRKVEQTNMSALLFGSYNGHWSAPYSKNLKAVLLEIKSCFETIILDMPPVLQNSASIDISRNCDGVIIIVHAGKTTSEQVNETKSRLQDSGVRIIGTILNRHGNAIPQALSKLI
ncbi:MAG: hypothetical protein DWQ10_10045 [Calditrichaeota bacterium]|nr:MAG: hypothetical protein DWQ10_10045 [Calditrichota bacterium]